MIRFSRASIGVAVAVFATSTLALAAESRRVAISAEELTSLLPGMACISAAGAKFMFTADGHYAYDGLWTSRGHYSIGDGRIFVIFDSGLGRYFALSKEGDVLYMEKTALSCSPVRERQSVLR